MGFFWGFEKVVGLWLGPGEGVGGVWCFEILGRV